MCHQVRGLAINCDDLTPDKGEAYTRSVTDDPLGLYVHVPFCTVKCAYCDFNSYAGINDLQDAWLRSVLRELSLWAPRVAGRPISTVFIGGGTPSLLPGEDVATLLDAIRHDYALNCDAEITLEANPESVESLRMRRYREAGVNRISMGVQSLDASELVFLDRLHSASRAESAFAEIREAGFENINVDLIYGLPHQTLQTWQSTLEQVLQWSGDGPDHLSCYALTVEEGTPLALRVANGQVIEADSDRVAAIADWTIARLADAGYERYETSNYARTGRECRHNLIYWRTQEYLAVGPGAHGFVDGVRYQVDRSPRRYIDQLSLTEGAQAQPHGLPSPAILEAESVSECDHLLDTLTSGLRLMAGIDEQALPDSYVQLRPVIEWAIDQGLAQRSQGQLSLTTRGHAVANEIFVRLVDPSLLD